MSQILIRLVILVAAIALVFISVNHVIKPRVFEPLCITDTNSCVQMEYWQKDNSILVHMLPAGYWFWFNGKYVYIYGQDTGRACSNTYKYDSVYVVDIKPDPWTILGYECVNTLTNVQKLYASVPKRGMFYRPDDPTNFNVYSAISLFMNRNIITKPTS